MTGERPALERREAELSALRRRLRAGIDRGAGSDVTYPQLRSVSSVRSELYECVGLLRSGLSAQY